MKHYETVKVEIADKVAKVILNRPDKKNAMNPQLHRDMTQVLEDLRYDDSAAFTFARAAGSSCFSYRATMRSLSRTWACASWTWKLT